MAEFNRAEPSAGCFITDVESGLGARAGVVTALLVSVGYTVAMARVFTMSGGMVTMTLDHYTSLHGPWEPLAVVLTIAAIWVTAKGVKLSTSVVGVALVAQVPVMLAVCVVALIDQRRHLSGVPFSWAHLSGGLTGLSRGFRWRYTCSSAGRTGRHWRRNPATQSASSRGPFTFRSRSGACSS